MREKGDRRIIQDPFIELRSIPPINYNGLQTLRELSCITYPARRKYGVLAMKWGEGTIDRQTGEPQRTVYRLLPEVDGGFCGVKRKIAITALGLQIKILLERQETANTDQGSKRKSIYDSVAHPQIMLTFTSAPYLLPAAIFDMGHEMPLTAQIRYATGREVVFSPAEYPLDRYHQQGFAAAFNAVTKALLL